MNITDWFLLAPRQTLAIAIAISIAAYALAANLTRMSALRKPRRGRLGRLLAWLQAAWVPRAAGELARWVYYIGVPYASLLAGMNTARALGVWNVEWLEPLAGALLLIAGAAIVFLWIWRPYARTEHPHAVDASRWNWARHITELIYQQAHWAFYRSGPILWLGNVYWGSFVGLGLTLIEAWTNPVVRSSVRDVTRADAPLWGASLAIVTTVLFIYTQNSWYCLGAHLFLDLILRHVIGFPKPAAEDVASFETEMEE